MREVEIKLQIADKRPVIKLLADQGCVLGDPVQQDDYIFLPKDDLARSAFNRPVLRLRLTKDGVILTLKRNITKEQDCLEREVAVTDFPAARELIEALDFSLWLEVHKQRQTGKIDGVSICLDTVAGLGDYVEVEKLIEVNGDYRQAEGELLDMITKLGIKGERVLQGYDTLMARQLDVRV